MWQAQYSCISQATAETLSDILPPFIQGSSFYSARPLGNGGGFLWLLQRAFHKSNMNIGEDTREKIYKQLVGWGHSFLIQ